MAINSKQIGWSTESNLLWDIWKQLERLGGIINKSSNIRHYGSFYDTTTQSVTAGSVKAMELNTVDVSSTDGFTIANNLSGRPTRITAQYTGVYNLVFSAQLNRSSGGSSQQVDIWIAINGNNVPWTNTTVSVQANANKLVASWNFFVKLNAGEYVELMWSQTDLITILSDVAGVNHPETPSLIATINQVG